MRLGYWGSAHCVLPVVGVLLLVVGCGHRAPHETSPVEAAKTADVPLPEWAPENPSAEFLRAAKVLRGVPMDAVGRGDMPEQSWRALLGYMRQINPTLWQLFGSLSDAQIDAFLAAKKIAIAVRDLTPGQRAALDAVLDANKGREIQMSGVTLPDFRTLLYKMGAKEGLSNVTIAFAIEGVNTLSFNARVHGVGDPLVWTGWAQAPRLGPKTSAVKPAGSRSEARSQTPLPEWAPKNPSPEFMRAWRVLKPTPQEEFTKFAEGDFAKLALAKRASQTWPAAFEFFGTLTDEQMKHFFSVRQVRMPVSSLSPGQRAALDNWLERWRSVMKGNGTLPEDFLVVLFKMGAREDLSNVDVGFNAKNEGRRVHTTFWVRQPDGSYSAIQNDFAYM